MSLVHGELADERVGAFVVPSAVSDPVDLSGATRGESDGMTGGAVVGGFDENCARVAQVQKIPLDIGRAALESFGSLPGWE
jgi:hypothetical protein